MFPTPTLLLSALLSLSLGLSVHAQMVPTSPSGSTVANIGSELTTLWEKDTTGVWDAVTIQLMSGDNFNMIPVTTLTTGIDATTLTSYTFTVPSVTPTSAIYFLQFTPGTGNLSDVTWTTRFTIAGEDGSITPPANALQPNGAAIPWGVGTLTDQSAANTGAAGGGSPASASMRASAASVASVASASASGVKTTAAAVTTPAVVVPAAKPATGTDSSSETATESDSGATALAAEGSNTAASGTGTGSRTAAAAATSTGAAVGGVKLGMGGVLGAVLAGIMLL